MHRGGRGVAYARGVVAAVAVVALGALLLTVGAEAFAEHVVPAARVVGLSVFGLAVLAAGAEPEEAWTAAVAAAQERPDLAAGDAVGANLVIATVTLGLLALVTPFVVTRTVLRYAVLATVTAVGALLVISDSRVTRLEGGVLVVVYAVIVAVLWRRERRPPAIGEMAEMTNLADDPPSFRAVGWVVAGLTIMVVGGVVAVEGAQQFVAASGLSDSAVGLTLLALATSAEMLALVWSARRRSLPDVALAGVVGAVIYNASVTLGVAGLVRPLQLSTGVAVHAVGTVVVVAMALLAAAYGRQVDRVAGMVLVVAYVATVVLLLR